MTSPRSSTTGQPRTAEHLLRMEDDGMRRELVRGELRQSMPAGQQHGWLAVRVTTSLDVFATENGLGRVYAAETG